MCGPRMICTWQRIGWPGQSTLGQQEERNLNTPALSKRYCENNRKKGKKRDPTPPMLKKWCYWGGNSISVCIVGF